MESTTFADCRYVVQRRKMNKKDLVCLAKRSDFNGPTIHDYLKLFPEGKYEKSEILDNDDAQKTFAGLEEGRQPLYNYTTKTWGEYPTNTLVVRMVANKERGSAVETRFVDGTEKPEVYRIAKVGTRDVSGRTNVPTVWVYPMVGEGFGTKEPIPLSPKNVFPIDALKKAENGRPDYAVLESEWLAVEKHTKQLIANVNSSKTLTSLNEDQLAVVRKQVIDLAKQGRKVNITRLNLNNAELIVNREPGNGDGKLTPRYRKVTDIPAFRLNDVDLRKLRFNEDGKIGKYNRMLAISTGVGNNIGYAKAHGELLDLHYAKRPVYTGEIYLFLEPNQTPTVSQGNNSRALPIQLTRARFSEEQAKFLAECLINPENERVDKSIDDSVTYGELSNFMFYPGTFTSQEQTVHTNVYRGKAVSEANGKRLRVVENAQPALWVKNSEGLWEKFIDNNKHNTKADLIKSLARRLVDLGSTFQAGYRTGFFESVDSNPLLQKLRAQGKLDIIPGVNITEEDFSEGMIVAALMMREGMLVSDLGDPNDSKGRIFKNPQFTLKIDGAPAIRTTTKTVAVAQTITSESEEELVGEIENYVKSSKKFTKTSDALAKLFPGVTASELEKLTQGSKLVYATKEFYTKLRSKYPTLLHANASTLPNGDIIVWPTENKDQEWSIRHEAVHVFLQNIKSALRVENPLALESYRANLNNYMLSLKDAFVKVDVNTLSPSVRRYKQVVDRYFEGSNRNVEDFDVEEGSEEDLLTYPLADPQLAKWLNSQTASRITSPSGKKSIWRKFVDLILDAIGGVVNNQSLLQQLHNVLEDYVSTDILTQPVIENEDLSQFDSADDYINSIIGFSAKLRNEIPSPYDNSTLVNIASPKELREIVRALTTFAVVGQNALSFGQGGKVNQRVLRNQVENIYQLLKKKRESTTGDTTDLDKGIALYEEILSDRVWPNLMVDVQEELRSNGLVSGDFTKESDIRDEDGRFFTEDAEIPINDKISNEIKLFVKMIPKMVLEDGEYKMYVNPITRLPVYESFNKKLPLLFDTMLGINSTDEMLNRIEERIAKNDENSGFFVAFKLGINSPTPGHTFEEESEVLRIVNLHTQLSNLFSMKRVSLTRTFVENQEGEGAKGYTIRVTSKGNTVAEKDYPAMWGLNLASNPDYLKFTENSDKTKSLFASKSFVDGKLKEFDNLKERLGKHLSKPTEDVYKDFLSQYVQLLNSIGIETSNKAISILLETEQNPYKQNGTTFGSNVQGLYTFLNLNYTGSNPGTYFAPRRLFAYTLARHIQPDRTPRNFNDYKKLYVNDDTVKIYANYEAITNPIRQHYSEDGPDGTKRYTISENNHIVTMTKVLVQYAKLVNEGKPTGHLDSIVLPILNSNYNKHSWLLEQVNGKFVRLQNLENLVDFTYVDKDAGDGGKYWSDMTVEEMYLSDLAKTVSNIMVGPVPAEKSTKNNLTVGERVKVGISYQFERNEKGSITAKQLANTKLRFSNNVIKLFDSYLDGELTAIEDAISNRKEILSNPDSDIRDTDFYYNRVTKEGVKEGNGLRFRSYKSVTLTPEVLNSLPDEIKQYLFEDNRLWLNKVLNHYEQKNGTCEEGFNLIKEILNSSERSNIINETLLSRVSDELDRARQLGFIQESPYYAKRKIPKYLININLNLPVNLQIDAQTALYKSEGFSETDGLNSPELTKGLSIFQLFADFAINNDVAKTEFNKVIYMDPALHKSSVDRSKRIAGPNSTYSTYRTDFVPNASMDDTFREGFEKFVNKHYLDGDTFKVLEIKDNIKPSDLLGTEEQPGELPKLLGRGWAKLAKEQMLRASSTGMLSEEMEADIVANTPVMGWRLAQSYQKMNIADAAVYISPMMYKQLLIREGKFTPEMSKAFDMLMLDVNPYTATQEDLERLGYDSFEDFETDYGVAYNVALSPLKTVYNGPLANTDGTVAQVFDKMAMFPVFSFMTSFKNDKGELVETGFAKVYREMQKWAEKGMGAMFANQSG